VIAHIRTGRLRALAVTSPRPSALLPDLPTVAESIPGYDASSTYGIFAPARTPAAIINQVIQLTVRFLKTAEGSEKFLNVGSDAVGSSAQELADCIKMDLPRWSKVIKESGIRAE
jgi:tripartite-type tricarboxylate transporter receptor subunit TctC